MNQIIDIEQIIKLVLQQEPNRQDIVDALRDTGNGRWENSGYYSFVNSKNANEPGAAWQLKENIVLQHEEKGEIVLDILKDGRIGGIEFISLIDQ